MEEKGSVRLADLPLDQVKDPKQPIRLQFDDDKLFELRESMSKVGLIEPIIVVAVDGGYEVVAGHRRLIVARQLEWGSIRAIVMPKLFEYGEVFKIHENLIREDVHPIDEANFLEYLMTVTGRNQKELAALIFRSEGYVSERMAIKTWPQDVVRALVENEVVYSTAREFAKITDDSVRSEYLRFAREGGINPATARKWREGWERDKLEREAGPPEVEAPEPSKRPDVIFSPCYICHEPHEITKSTMVRVCEKCVDEVLNRRA